LEPVHRGDADQRAFARHLFLREGPFVREPAREAAVVAFASGKGGTGKTFLTVNTAIALHERGRRVVVVDCDFGLANAHLLFGVNPQCTLAHVLEGGLAVDEALIETPHGPALVPGGSGVVSLADLDARHMEALARALHTLGERYDVVMLDCGAGLAPQSLIPVLAAQHVVLVANPEIASVTDAYALVKCLAKQAAAATLHLAVNRVPEDGLGRATHDRLADVARRFARREVHYLGEVPEDPAAAHRRLGQPPLVKGSAGCATAKAVQTLADRLDPRLERTRQVPDQGIEARMRAQILRW
jgi:flagellar biosynthesis protein FlhG